MPDEEIVTPETTNEPVTETVETPDVEPELDLDLTPEVDVEQLQATNKKLFERAKKAEAELKASKATPAQAKGSPQLDPVEAALLVNGMPEELLGELKAVAKVRGVSLLKAQSDPIYVAVKDKFEKDQKQKDASLPASRGSGATKVQKDFNTPNLTAEEHRAMFKSL